MKASKITPANVEIIGRKIIAVVFENTGENVGTYDPKCFLSSFTGNVDEKTQRLINSDWNQLVETNLYEVREISMPEFWNEATFMRNYLKFRYLHYLVGNVVYSWNETMLNNAFRLDSHYQFFIGYLLKPRKKANSFMESISQQVISWLQNEENKYNFPLSANQYSSANRYCDFRECDRKTNELYYLKLY